jgi:hypothetical protein
MDMSIPITAKEYNQLIIYGHLSTTKQNLGQLKQNYKYIKIWVIKQIEWWRGIKNLNLQEYQDICTEKTVYVDKEKGTE